MSGLGYPMIAGTRITDTEPEGRDFLLSPYILMTYGYRIKSIEGWDIPIIPYSRMDYRIVRKAFGECRSTGKGIPRDRISIRPMPFQCVPTPLGREIEESGEGDVHA